MIRWLLDRQKYSVIEKILAGSGFERAKAGLDPGREGSIATMLFGQIRYYLEQLRLRDQSDRAEEAFELLEAWIVLDCPWLEGSVVASILKEEMLLEPFLSRELD